MNMQSNTSIVLPAALKPKGFFANLRAEIKAAHPDLKGNALSIMVRDEAKKQQQVQNDALVIGVGRLIKEGYTFDRGTITKTGSTVNLRLKKIVEAKPKGDKLPTEQQVKAYLAKLTEDERFALQEAVEREEVAPAIEATATDVTAPAAAE